MCWPRRTANLDNATRTVEHEPMIGVLRVFVGACFVAGSVGCSSSSGAGGRGGTGATGAGDQAGGGTDGAGPQGGGADVGHGGRVTYTFDNQVFRIQAKAGATPENISEALGAPALDRRSTMSQNGQWIVMLGERYGCVGECLLRVSEDLQAGEVVRPGGEDIYVEGTSAITNDGNRIVYSSQGGPHEVDLFITERTSSGWGAPVLLTGDSTYAWNNMPALGWEEATVLFDCGSEPYPEAGGNDACKVQLDGEGFTKYVGPDTLPDAREDKVQNPHAGPDGVYFEATWPVGGESPELIWRMRSIVDAPEPVGAAFPNAVSPCVLPDGRWVMLWLGSPDNPTGRHELTLVNDDGTATVLTPGVDVTDDGIGCGG